MLSLDLLSLLSSSSLPSQLINFLFWRLSPVSSISPFLYSHCMPFLPFLHTLCYFHPHQVPIFMFSLSHFLASLKSIVSWKLPKYFHKTDICLFLPLLQFCPLYPPLLLLTLLSHLSSIPPPHPASPSPLCMRWLQCMSVHPIRSSVYVPSPLVLFFSPGAPDWGLSAQPSGWGSGTEQSTLEMISGLCPRYWEIINALNEITNQMECDGSLS